MENKKTSMYVGVSRCSHCEDGFVAQFMKDSVPYKSRCTKSEKFAYQMRLRMKESIEAGDPDYIVIATQEESNTGYKNLFWVKRDKKWRIEVKRAINGEHKVVYGRSFLPGEYDLAVSVVNTIYEVEDILWP